MVFLCRGELSGKENELFLTDVKNNKKGTPFQKGFPESFEKTCCTALLLKKRLDVGELRLRLAFFGAPCLTRFFFALCVEVSGGKIELFFADAKNKKEGQPLFKGVPFFL